MIDQFTNLEDGDIALPTSSLDLSARMRDLRARQGLKQSEVARRMGLDPSIPSLWEQGKRMVPANRVRALADALEVSVEELLEGVSGAQRSARPAAVDTSSRQVAELLEDRGVRQRPTESGPLLRLLPPRGRCGAGRRWRPRTRRPSHGSWPNGRRWTAGFPTAGVPRIAFRTSAPRFPMGTGWTRSNSKDRRRDTCCAVGCATRIAGRGRARSAGRGAGRADLQPLQPGPRVHARHSPAAGGNDLPMCVDGRSRRPDRWRAGRDAARALGRRPCFGHLAAPPARLGAAVSHSTRRRRSLRRPPLVHAAAVDAR